MKQYYQTPLPKCDLTKLTGKLIVIEGPDGSGRSTQIARIQNWLEAKGYAVVTTDISRSQLVGPELEQARRGNVLGPTTLALFYATDFMDLYENMIIPGLRSGFIVLADRYFYTLMARDLVRGADFEWVEKIFGVTIVPDIVFYLDVYPRQLLKRRWQMTNAMDYWESGMDLGISRDWVTSFLIYQSRLRRVFKQLQAKYNFVVINGNRSIPTITKEIIKYLEPIILSNTESGPERGNNRLKLF